jgi:hypothetical protein
MSRLVVGLALVAALAALPRASHDVHAATRDGDRQAYDHGIPAIQGAPPDLGVLVQRVRAEVPGHEPVRLVIRDVSCVRLGVGHGGGLQFWLAYQLLPHPVTCDPGARWQVYVDSAVPDGAEVVTDRLAIVRAR